jgi:hypothetical protein
MAIAVQRRVIITSFGFFLLQTGIGKAAVPQGVEARRVRIQLDDGALKQIPGDERTDLQVKQDASPAAQALIQATPSGRAIPIIFVVVGILSIPVIWDTIREMLRRDYYGGVLIDARQMPALIVSQKSLPANTILFIGPDGHSTRYEATDVPEDILLKIAKVP